MKEKIKKKFTHLKIHSQYSICEGALKISDLAELCKKNKTHALAICDTNNLCGAIEFSEKISNVGTQPIIGVQIKFKYKNKYGKISLYAKDIEGYKNLTKLSSRSYLNIKETEEPHCKIEDLIKNSSGVVVLSGGIYGLIGKLFSNNLSDDLEDLLKKIKNTFNSNFYLEIQRHGDQGEKNFETYLLNASKKLEIPLIASHEVFYLDQDMHEAHDAFLCVGEKTYVNENNRTKYTNQHYLKNSEEMSKLFFDLPEALENNFNFPYKFSYRPKKSKPIIPTVGFSETQNIDEDLKMQAFEGLNERLKNYVLVNIEKSKHEFLSNTYKKRLDHELSIINQMKYSGYFLIVSDYIKWAKKNNIPVGPGRGSGAGSLVAWCLSITDIDPIKFDLIFERFLNPDRISMPDFDIDFCEEKRDLVFNYLKKKYGNGVAHIITFGKLKARMALRDIGRVLGLPYGFVDSLCKMIPFDPSRPISLADSIAREPRIQKQQKNDPRVKKLIDLSLKLEGLNRNVATHAAGVVIAEKNLSELVPLYKDFSSNSVLPATQFDMYSAEDFGLIKFDLLGLKTLTVINKTLSLLKKTNVNLDINKISLDDKKVFELLSSGHTIGLFQLESAGMRDALKSMKPNRFEDIIALVALYRPGPMNNIAIYNQCKHGIKKPDYLHPKLKNILEPTYGVIIYQEQVMRIAQTLAGFSPGEADILRKAMGKKKRAELEKQKERFVSGAINNGIQKDIANFIFQKIEPFAEYGFNKSHAAAYALISYQTAYLKTYYPNEFLSASMSNEFSNTDKLREFYEELKRLDIKVVPPSINESYSEFIPEDKKQYYALGAIKNVGLEAIKEVIVERERHGKFSSLENFIERINPKNINKLQLEGLVKAGAFDCIEKNRKYIFDFIPQLIQKNKRFAENKNTNQGDLFKESNLEISKTEKSLKLAHWQNDETLLKEYESIGFYFSSHPLVDYKEILDLHGVKTYAEFEKEENSTCTLAGTLMKIQEKKTSKGTSFAIAKFSDTISTFEIFIFSELLEKNRGILKEGDSFLITVLKDKKNQENRFKRISVIKIVSLKEISKKDYELATIEIEKKENLDELSKCLNISGNTKIKVVIIDEKNKFLFELKNKRKLNSGLVKDLRKHDFVRKISI